MLSADTRYYYALGATGTNFPASAEHYFVTSPTQTRPVRLWAIGDAGTADYSAASVRDAVVRPGHRYRYRVETTVFGETFAVETEGIAAVPMPDPERRLSNASPNPFLESPH